MTVLRGETGLIEGPLKTLTFNYSPTEADLSLVLPLTKPATPQLTYTLNPSAVTITGGQVPVYWLQPMLLLAGKNDTGGSVTVYIEVYRNGVIVPSNLGGSMNKVLTANQYWTAGFIRAEAGYAYGDVFEMYAWASVDNVSLFYSGGMVVIDRMGLEYRQGTLLKDLTIDYTIQHNVLQGATGYTKYSAWNGGYLLTVASNGNSTLLSSSYTRIFLPYLGYNEHSVYKFAYTGGFNTNGITGINVSSSYVPFIQQSCIPLSISFREIIT